jgi:actin-related protein
MFDPKKIGQDAFGMHENIIEVTKRAEQVEIQKMMLGNIVLSGGNTLFRNLVERVESGVK